MLVWDDKSRTLVYKATEKELAIHEFNTQPMFIPHLERVIESKYLDTEEIKDRIQNYYEQYRCAINILYEGGVLDRVEQGLMKGNVYGMKKDAEKILVEATINA